MKKEYIFLLLLFSFSSLSVLSSEIESNYNYYRAFAVDSTNYYIGLVNGFVVQNKSDGKSEYYTTINSNLKSNFISDILVVEHKVYVATNNGLYLFDGTDFTNLNVGINDIRELKIDSLGNIWTFDANYVYKYDGVETKSWDVRDFISVNVEIAQIDLVDGYVWISMYQGFPYNNYYSRVQMRNYRFGLLNLESNQIEVFTEEERGFRFRNTINFQAICNEEIWVGVSIGEYYIFDLATKQWRTNEHLNKIPKSYELTNWDVVSDNQDKVWFALMENGDPSDRYIANYNYETDEVSIKFAELDSIEQFSPFYFERIGDNIVVNDSYGIYVINNDEIEIYKRSEFTEDDFYYSEFAQFEDEFFFLLKKHNINYEPLEIANLNKKSSTTYTKGKDTKTIVPSIRSYGVDNNSAFIEGGRDITTTYSNYFYVGDSWKKEHELGIRHQLYSVDVNKFSNGDFTVYSDSVYGVLNNELVTYAVDQNSKYRQDRVMGLDIYNDNLYLYGSQAVEGTSNSVYETYISVFNRNNKEIMVYDKENSCLTDFQMVGEIVVSPVGPYPLDISVDKEGNIWCLTSESLFVIQQDGDCKDIDYMPYSKYNYIEANKLVYSTNYSNTYAWNDDRVYNLNSTVLDSVNSYDIVGSGITYLGDCSDGNVYLTTNDGRLFLVKSIGDWQQIKISNIKDKTGLSITHVSYYNDSLYLSTDIGLLKVKKPELTDVNEAINLDEFSLYPNPTSDYIYLDNYSNFEKIQVRSTTGQVVLLTESQKQIDISDLTSGVYLITTGDGKLLGRFVKR